MSFWCQEPASRPVDQPSGMSWLAHLFFVVFRNLSWILPNMAHVMIWGFFFLKKTNVGICFVMISSSVRCFWCKIITYVSLNEFLGVRSQPADQSTSQVGWVGCLRFYFCLFMVFRHFSWISPNITHVMIWSLFLILGYVS